MSDTAAGFIIGIMVSLFVWIMAGDLVGQFPEAKLKEMQKQCELSLPRTQKCVIEFVPEKVKQ